MSSEISPQCTQCGTPIPGNAPAGLCPNCLMALNLVTETAFSGDATTAVEPPLPPEQIAPHFPQLEILECLGRGGMGVVYKARQKTLNRVVALKLLAPERVNDPRFAERFAREAQALAALSHPNIVTIHDFGQAGGFYFLLMEFVDGANLRQLLRARKFTPEEALAIVPPLCDALQFAHERGIVHRDIKPENLLLDKAGRVKIADFGIAKIMGVGSNDSAGPAAPRESATHGTIGTPGYSAPEQLATPELVDSRSDIFSLGVVFYEMLTGELPGKAFELPSKKVHVDVRLDEVVLRALEQNPEQRYQKASAFKTQVEEIATTPLHDNPQPTPIESPQNLSESGTLPDKKSAPALMVVAMLFILVGIWSLLDMLFSGGMRNASIAPGAFGLPIGIGLLHWREACRRLALGCVKLSGVCLIIMLGWIFGKAFGAFKHPGLVVKLFGHSVLGGAGALLAAVAFIGQLVVLPWIYLTLKRSSVRAAFAASQTRARPWLEWGTAVIIILTMLGVVRFPWHNHRQTGVYFTDIAPIFNLTTARNASAEHWSPALAPGEKPNVSNIRDEIKLLMDKGDYEASLQRQIWYFNHALEFGEVNPVRMTFGIMNWNELGRRYPKAREALLEIRDEKAQQISSGHGTLDLVQDVQALNEALQDEDATYELFKVMRRKDPKLAANCYFHLEAMLVSKGEYQWCYDHMRGPQWRFDLIRQGFELDQKNLKQRVETQKRSAQALADFNQQHGTTNNPHSSPRDNSAFFEKSDTDRFVGSVQRLIEILVATDHGPEAEKIRDEALKVLDDVRLKNSLEDAADRIQKHSTPASAEKP